MKIFLATLFTIISISSFAKDITLESLDGTILVSSNGIYDVLKSDISILKNSRCLAFNIRRAENIDLRFTTGQYLSSISFQVKVIDGLDKHQSEVLSTTANFKNRFGEDSGSLTFNCETKNTIGKM